ncbi:hypothetical protein ACP70R_019579 [Stipagrostis hirtigluma subsp. patula]
MKGNLTASGPERPAGTCAAAAWMPRDAELQRHTTSAEFAAERKGSGDAQHQTSGAVDSSDDTIMYGRSRRSGSEHDSDRC